MSDNQTTAQQASKRLLDSMFDAARAANARWDALDPKPICECGRVRFDRTILVCRDCWDEMGRNETPVMPWEM